MTNKFSLRIWQIFEPHALLLDYETSLGDLEMCIRQLDVGSLLRHFDQMA